jgi:hypothetical protein
MDIVYERAALCVAPLDYKVATQSEMNPLAMVMKELAQDLKFDTIISVAEVISSIANDP